MRKFKKPAQSLIEYGLILALVAVIAVTVLSKFGKTITNVGTKVDTNVSTTTDNASESYCKSIGATYDSSSGTCSSTSK